jgi:glycosyltransferase involved in cell wall biosynthesis
MVKVAFWFDSPLEYSGGLNYLKNLLYALSLVNDGSVRPYVFFAKDIPANIEAQFAPYATVVRTRLLQRGTLPWFAHRVVEKFLGSMLFVTRQLKANDITVVSHVWFEYKGRVPFRIISWLPDFQYLHLPELFPTLDPAEETRRNQAIIAQSDVVILSSYDALEDFKRIAPPGGRARTAVIQFVSQPRNGVPSRPITQEALEQQYGFRGRFFILPNQFWAHKNHMVVLRALNRLKNEGTNVLVLCTGNTQDYRSKDTTYINSIREFIEVNSLQDHMKILGHIDHDEVLFMMKHSIAVLNPSRFEGWSSSVEEAKSIGKPVILSRIGVHVEQNPPNGRYFDPDDDVALARLLAEAWTAPPGGSQDHAERLAQDALRQRTIAYGRAYLDLVNSIAPRSVG